MSEQEQEKNVNQDIGDAAEAELTGELSEQDLGGVAGGNKYADDFKQLTDAPPTGGGCAYAPKRI